MTRLEAYEKFHERLQSGDLRAGQFVTQKELAALIGVPIGTAREAIQRLEFESILKVYPQRGIQVTDATVQLIREAFGFRKMMEKEAINNFAAHAPVAMIGELLQTTVDVSARYQKTPSPEIQAEAVEIDWTFHDAIIDHTKNSIVIEAYRVNAARIRLVRGGNNRLSPQRVVSALNEHIAVLEACLARDHVRAVQEIENHIDKAMQISLENA